MSLNTVDTDAILYRDDRAELIELRADLQAAQKRNAEWEAYHGDYMGIPPADQSEQEQHIAELEAIIALNRYVTPPFDLVDDATVQLALECAAKDERITALETTMNEARKLPDSWRGESSRGFESNDVAIGLVNLCAAELEQVLAAHPAPE